MAVDSKFFNIPFATSGDKATIPEAVQPSGAISFTQGFGPDYERNPATDPLAKRVPRDETNEYLYQITNALKYMQWYGTPQYTSVADGGPANYPISARVRYDAGAGMQAWRSIAATNTAIPGSDASKWAVDEAFSLTALEATVAEAVAGTLGTKIITPRRLSAAVQRNQWAYVLAGGTPTVMTASLGPTITAYTDIFGAPIRVNMSGLVVNGPAPTINFNGLGAVSIKARDGQSLLGGEMTGVVEVIFDGTQFLIAGPPSQFRFRQVFSATGTFTVPTWCRRVKAYVTGGGGRGSNCQASGGNYVSGGGGGAGGTVIADLTVTPGAAVAATVGLGGVTNGQAGASSSFSTLSATGGAASVFTVATSCAGGAPGVGSGGDINLKGGYGSDGQSGSIYFAGNGGDSFWGGSGRAGNQAGIAGAAPGSGGGGAYDGSNTGTVFNGGSGANGLIVVEY